MAKVVFLTGAPAPDTLAWDDEETLLSAFQSPIRRFLGDHHRNAVLASTPSLSASIPLPKWRIVSCSSDIDANASADASASATVQTSGEDHMTFLEHSLALLTAREFAQNSSCISFYDATTPSFDTSSSDPPSSSSNSKRPPSSPSEFPDSLNHSTPKPHPLQSIAHALTDLVRIPPASHILHIHPQTMTVNLIAAVITVSPTRTIDLRKWNTEKDIIEVLLGDETRSNFSITFWFSAAGSQARGGKISSGRKEKEEEEEELRGALVALRTGDVVLMKNIALAEYRGAVYGQSLSRGFAKNCTKLVVLISDDDDAAGIGVVRRTGLPGVVGGKIARVREWSGEFVGRERRRVRAVGIDGRDGEEELPEDQTQKMGSISG